MVRHGYNITIKSEDSIITCSADVVNSAESDLDLLIVKCITNYKSLLMQLCSIFINSTVRMDNGTTTVITTES